MQPSSLRALLRFFFNLITIPEPIGLENVPAKGACILATNHMSRIDVPFEFVATPRSDLIALVGHTYKENLFFYWIIKTSRSIWIDRDRADFTAMRAALEHLRKGGMLGIAPEGTRSRISQLLPAKTGIALVAEKARVPIVPVAVEGTENCMQQLRRLIRPRLKIHFGLPFTLPPVERADREASLQRNTDEVMCRIAAMLPARYHGAYAGNARLQELLGDKEARVSGVATGD